MLNIIDIITITKFFLLSNFVHPSYSKQMANREFSGSGIPSAWSGEGRGGGGAKAPFWQIDEKRENINIERGEGQCEGSCRLLFSFSTFPFLSFSFSFILFVGGYHSIGDTCPVPPIGYANVQNILSRHPCRSQISFLIHYNLNTNFNAEHYYYQSSYLWYIAEVHNLII